MQFDIRRFDIYRKVPKDLTEPTTTGAVISILSVIFMLYLFAAELMGYLEGNLESELYVSDPVNFTDSINVEFSITLLNLRCEFAGIDVQDDLGRHEVGMANVMNKTSANANLGCRIDASFNLKKVPGNFHVSTHASGRFEDVDMSHHIHYLRFGHTAKILQFSRLSKAYASLDNRAVLRDGQKSHDYRLRLVPTVVEDVAVEVTDGHASYPLQFTYGYQTFDLETRTTTTTTTTARFKYEFSPIMVHYRIRRLPFYHFLTMICAIIGGTFTVAGIVDSLLFSASKVVQKLQLDKLN